MGPRTHEVGIPAPSGHPPPPGSGVVGDSRALVLLPQDGAPEPDPERVRADELLGAWIDRNKAASGVRPSRRTCGMQAAAAKRICEQYTRAEIHAAWAGMGMIFPYAEPPVGRSAAWSIVNLETHFHEAAREAVKRHPAVRQARQQQDAAEFAAQVRSMGYG
jgi:hypothetical protein